MADKYVSHDNYAGDAIEHGTGTVGDPYNLIASGIDNLGSGDECLLKIDGTYTQDGVDQPAASIDYDGVDGKAIRAYKTTVGDCDPGGPYYRDPTNGYAVIDCASMAADCLVVSGAIQDRGLYNLSFTANAVAQSFISFTAAAQPGYIINNCKFNATVATTAFSIEMFLQVAAIIEDCIFTGSYGGRGSVGAIDSTASGGIIQNCLFDDVGTAFTLIRTSSDGQIIRENAFYFADGTSVDVAVILANIAATIHNNTIYHGSTNVAVGISLADGGNVYNNIIIGATTAINGTASYADYNAYPGNSEPNGLDSDSFNPRLVDPANGDFTPLYSKIQASGRSVPFGVATPIGAVPYKRRNSILVPATVGSPITGAF